MDAVVYEEIARYLLALMGMLVLILLTMEAIKFALRVKEHLDAKAHLDYLRVEELRLQGLGECARQVLEEIKEKVGRYRDDPAFGLEAPGFFDIQFPPAEKFWTAMTQWQDRDDGAMARGDELLEEAEELQRLLEQAVAAARAIGPNYLPPTKYDRRDGKSIVSRAMSALRGLPSRISKLRGKR